MEETDKKHRCIISCKICLRCHEELLNQIERIEEVVKDVMQEFEEFFELAENRFENILRILKGESH